MFQDIGVKRRIKHEDYSVRFAYNDIALIQLERPVKFTRYIKPICLPISEVAVSNKRIFAAGFGHDRFSGKPTRVLMKTRDLKLVQSDQCLEAFSQEPKFM